MIKKPTKIRFINPDIKDAYLKLKEGTNDEKKLYKWITNAFNDLKNNGFGGLLFQKIEYLKNIDNYLINIQFGNMICLLLID